MNVDIDFGSVYYALSESEMNALRNFVDRNVKDGLMTPTVAPNGAQVLQVKRGWKLQVTYNCRAPQSGTIQNQYLRMSLPNMGDPAHLASYGEFVQVPGYPYPAYVYYTSPHMMTAWYPVGLDLQRRTELKSVFVLTATL